MYNKKNIIYSIPSSCDKMALTWPFCRMKILYFYSPTLVADCAHHILSEINICCMIHAASSAYDKKNAWCKREMLTKRAGNRQHIYFRIDSTGFDFCFIPIITFFFSICSFRSKGVFGMRSMTREGRKHYSDRRNLELRPDHRGSLFKLHIMIKKKNKKKQISRSQCSWI